MNAGLRALFAAALLAAAATALQAAGAEPQDVAALDLRIEVDPVSRMLRGAGTLTLPPGDRAQIVLSSRFTEARVRSGPATPATRRPDPAEPWRWQVERSGKARQVSLVWSGRLAPLDTSLDHRATLTAAEPVTGPEGTFLPSVALWYPTVPDMPLRYRVAVSMPSGQKAVVPGRLASETEDASGYRAQFEFPHPTEGVDLMAGPYRVDERTVRLDGNRAVRVRTYFAPGLETLSTGYLDAVAGYLVLYDRWIGDYPYTEFSVVSSPTPTGFGMPTLTYLGSDVLRLPFIRATSLGHEVLHNWWGNGVYPDYRSGNWSEGLTTFMADYAYKLRESPEAARDMRLAWLRDFAAVPAGQDRPLAQFTSRTHGTSQIVGYHKAAMLFVMLRDLVGEDAFDRGIRRFWTTHRFGVASWADLRAAWEHASGRDLGAFFTQWTGRPGAPSIEIADARRARTASGKWQVELRLRQGEPAFSAAVPIRIRTEGGSVDTTVDMTGTFANATLTTDARPTSVEVDPELRVFRRLAPHEAPPILRDVMVHPATAVVVLDASDDYVRAANALVGKLLDATPRALAPTAALDGVPAVVLGTAPQVDGYRRRNGLATPPEPVATASGPRVWTERARSATVLFVVAEDAATLAALARPLPHYGTQSWLTFEGGKAVGRGVWAPQPTAWTFD